MVTVGLRLLKKVNNPFLTLAPFLAPREKSKDFSINFLIKFSKGKVKNKFKV